jgi:hypothetical protein
MFGSSRHIPFRLFVALLALSVVAFPAAAAGVVSHCRAGESVRQGDDAPRSCCARHAAESERGEDADAPASSGCPNCPHACCRPAVDVVHVRLDLVALDGEVVAPVMVPAESVHDPVTCDAIFHPPRA